MAILSSGRALLDAPAILTRAGLASGMRYADFGCGPLGHFVIPASEIVGPEGRVFAVDVLKSVLASLEDRIRVEMAKNISVVWGDFERPSGVAVPSGSFHLVSVVNIVPILLRSADAVAEVRRTLRPDGKLLLVDWIKEDTAIGPPVEQRVNAAEAELILTKAGFTLKQTFAAGPYHWAQVFSLV
jgi:ubiquinone/menaquinone biosynthesis C-methylase UbiE